MANAKDKLIAARTALVLDEPFFGALVLGLALKADPGCGTAWVDGKTLGYSPAFIESLSHAQTTALLAHEVMHCAGGHPWRRDGRDKAKWNAACDKAINGVLRDSKFTLPEGALYPEGEEAGKSAEWICNRMIDPPEGDGPAGPQDDPAGDPGGDSGGSEDGDEGEPGTEPGGGSSDPQGEVRDAPTEADEDGTPAPTEEDWKQAVQQAALAAKAAGNLPGSLARLAADAVKPVIDWRSSLRRFLQTYAAADYSWTRPNSRYIAGGLYMPALRSEELGEIVIAVDTSGSMDSVALAKAKAELIGIMDECRPSKVTVMYADHAVARVDEFQRDEPVEFTPAGGGGTSFCPVFEAVAEMTPAPACVVYITDLCGKFPTDAPDLPVIWVTDGADKAPFGETLAINE